MIFANTWIEDYLNGHELEQSYDGQHWTPVIEEPYAGSGVFYRRKEKPYQSHNPLPRSERELPHSFTSDTNESE